MAIKVFNNFPATVLHQTEVLFPSWIFHFMSLLSRSKYESAREASNIVDIFRSNTFTDRPMYLEVQAWFARLDQRLRQPDVKRRQHKYLLVFQLQILGVCKGYIRKMAERYYLPLSLCVFLRLSSPICHNPDLLHRRLSGGLLISIRPSSWFVLIRSFGAFGFLGLYTSCMFLMRLIVSVQECWFDKHKLIHCLQRVTNESLVSSGTPFRICNSNVDNSNCPIAFGVVSPG